MLYNVQNEYHRFNIKYYKRHEFSLGPAGRLFEYHSDDGRAAADSVTIIIIEILKVGIMSEGIVASASVDGVDRSDVVPGVMHNVLGTITVGHLILVTTNTDR